MKKKTIFRLFMIPLITVMVIQALISYGTFLFSGTPFQLSDNAVGILKQTVENRKLILENNMVQNWSDLFILQQTAAERLETLLKREGIAVSEFLENETLKEQYLQKMITPSLEQMRKNTVTGAFLILSDLRDTEDKEQAGGKECSGIYFRNSGPGTVNKNNTDLLMERGDARFSHEMNIPLGNLWTTRFHFAPSGEKVEDEFFYEPYMAALAHPGIATDKLGFWSRPFTLNDREKDSYELITYSIPLRCDETVYGVLGVEISVRYLEKNLPARELVAEGDSGYMLAEYHEDGTLFPLVSTFQGIMNWSGEGIATQETSYNSLRRVVMQGEDQEVLYVDVSRLHLYDSHTPFSDRVWVVAGIQSRDKLFGMGNRIIFHLLFVILVGLAFGVVCICLIVSHLTRPIRRLSECIVQSSGAQLKDYSESGIREIDGLYDVVKELTLKQQKAENSLTEEKERYRIALQSSMDALFSYDVEKRTVELYNARAIGGLEDAPEQHFNREECMRVLETQVHEEDRSVLTDQFRNAEDEIYVVFESGTQATPEDYRWLELSGKVLFDTDGRKNKIIGSIRNIHEQKVKELAMQDMVRRDAVMGIYKRSTGESLIAADLEAGKPGCLALLDIDRFLELDEKYGMVFGDAILEQIGGILRHKIKEIKEAAAEVGIAHAGAGSVFTGAAAQKLTAVRMGGDEVLLWMEGYTIAQAKELLEELRGQVERLYEGASFRLQISGGLAGRSEREDYRTLLERTRRALCCSKLAGNGQDAVYEELTQEQLRLAVVKPEISDIVDSVYDRNLGTVPLVFNFFDKSSDLMGIMPVLLAKLGNRYGLSDILVTVAEPEFCTAHVSWQWHRAVKDRVDERPRYFSREEFEGFLEGLEDRMVPYEEADAEKTQKDIFLLPQGSSGWVVPFYDNGRYAGSITYAAGQSTITETDRGELQEISKIMEANINREKYDLASRAKSDFLSRMSHEIRTPMNAIMGMTSIALNELGQTDKVEECLNKIDSSSQYLLRLINDILDMSKIESGKMKLEISDFSLRELTEGIHSLMLPQLTEKKLRYEEDIRIDREWVQGDLLHLKQVLVNLLSNAVKFTPEGGRIRLTVHQEQEEKDTAVYFSVADTGIGISEQNRKRIFQSFEQADGNTARVYGGTGLGLAISQKLVYMMGGHIKLASEEGRGSDFSFRIRLKQGVPQEKKVKEPVKKDRSGGTRRILLVEDNELNMEIARTILEMHACVVETAENGAEAVEKFAAGEPDSCDLILMDIRMPVMDGLEATRKIRSLAREDARKIPIVAMSANAFAEDVRKSLESGMNHHLSKPINVEELMDTLDRMIL